MAAYPYDINERCLIVRLTEELSSLPFICGDTEGDKDLEDFFHNQALLYGYRCLFHGTHFFIGQQVLNYIKTWFTEEDNKTGCRFLVVDAYNKERILKFYERNKFKFLYADEATEKREQHVEEENEALHTRHMFLDLLHTEILTMPSL